MLLLVVVMAALSQLPGATAAYSEEYNISGCPFHYYGQEYDTVYVNISAGVVEVCFRDFYMSAIVHDCFLIRHDSASLGDITTTDDLVVNGSLYHLITGLTGTSPCAHILTVKNDSNGSVFNLHFRSFGKQGVLMFKKTLMFDVNMTVIVDNVEVGQWIETTGRPVIYGLVTSCRHLGVVYLTDTKTCDSEGSFVTCSKSAELSVIPQHKGCAEEKFLCTVTGPSIIDFNGGVTSLQDRCAYLLLSDSGFKLQAAFQERRRRDVVFLDRVILYLPSSHVRFYLEQGGKVWLDDTELSLSSLPQLHHGVELQKDHTGVTVMIPQSNGTTSLFFDGNTAQVHHVSNKWMRKGESTEWAPSLCANSSTPLSAVRVSEHSSSCCEMKYTDSPDVSTDCPKMTARCNLLRGAPFINCHNDIDPEPYITACNDTLCRYPSGNRLQCQFLEAYAKACQLLRDETLKGWRSNTNCHSTQDVCRDTFCSDHEFCTEGIDGQSSCFCRAIFASEYRSNNTIVKSPICGQNSALVTLVGCLLEEKGIDYRDLQLNHESCRGQKDNVTHMVTFSFNGGNSCGSVITANDSQITFRNTIRSRNTSSLITRQGQFKIDFSCYYKQPKHSVSMEGVHLQIKDNSVIRHIASGAWEYTLSMKFYTNAGRTQMVDSSTDLKLDQTIWVELMTDGLDDTLVTLVTDSCWATNEPSPSGSLRYDLIKNGCSNPADPTVMVEANGQATANYFSFKMFQFAGINGNVYLHCSNHLCVRNNNCRPSCVEGSRRRRSVGSNYRDDNPAFITMAWTN